MDLVNEVEDKINKGQDKASKVKYPVRVSYRDRYKHPVRIIHEDLPKKEVKNV